MHLITNSNAPVTPTVALKMISSVRLEGRLICQRKIVLFTCRIRRKVIRDRRFFSRRALTFDKGLNSRINRNSVHKK